MGDVRHWCTENTACRPCSLSSALKARRYLFIVDGAKALTKAIRRTFGADIPIQRCQIHKARNITDRLDPNITQLCLSGSRGA